MVLEAAVVADWVVVDTAPVAPLVGDVAVPVRPAALAPTGPKRTAIATARNGTAIARITLDCYGTCSLPGAFAAGAVT